MNKIKYLILCTLAAFTFGTAISCQKADNKNTTSNQPDNKAVTNTNSPINAATPAPANTSSTSSGSPTDAYKAAYTARKNKDIAALKKVLSKDIIEFFTMMGTADEKNKKSVDDLLKELCDRPQASTAEARNEKIDGDTATIEYLDEEGSWRPMDLVKEDGVWKLTIAKADKEPADDKRSNK